MLGPAISTSTHMQALRWTVSREEFDRMTAELDQVNAKLLGIKDELDVWQKTTVDSFRRYLLDNQGTLVKHKPSPKP